MPFNAGLRRSKRVDTTGAWTEKLESLYGADHPGHPGRFSTYVQYTAFLTAGTIEHHWTAGTTSDGRLPFVPVGRAEDFLPDLHQKMRSFRQSRHIHGISSPELVRQSCELLDFLGERVPPDKLQQFLAIARTYIMRNQDECFSA
jgi:hypothetical protein